MIDVDLMFVLMCASCKILAPQHQGTRVTSPTVAVPEVTWFPDVVFAKTMFCFVFVQISLLFEFCFGNVVAFVAPPL